MCPGTPIAAARMSIFSHLRYCQKVPFNHPSLVRLFALFALFFLFVLFAPFA